MARILVVDDDPELLGMIELLLERRGGYKAVLSADGQDAISKAKENPPDLAVVDVMMPGMTGYDVCRALREQPETASIPILVLTARGQAVDRQAALEAGADEHMAKPVRMGDLLEWIDRTLPKRPAVSTSRTMTLLSLKGGVGVTTVTANLAAILAGRGDGSVCIVDLSPSSGHVALQFGHRPQPNWSSLMEKESLTTAKVESLLLEPVPELHILASPVVPLVDQELPRSTVEALLEILQNRFEFLLIDTPSVLNEATVAALKASTDVWLVAVSDAASVQTVFGTLRALSDRWDGLLIVMNQVAETRRTSSDAIERLLKRPVSGTLPFDPDQAQALAQGEPLAVGAPDSPLPQAVAQVAKNLL